ncbi:hypothetical protein WR25_04978 [Diploscapter pachys]|uniref:TMEM9 family protein n=1 Tax=Diploscapter pachys TaxID=2018661 RepID=A0A2A2J517_9BILA|nr:hypothetical protein WR25_04978 [Diploscapter pachys]
MEPLRLFFTVLLAYTCGVKADANFEDDRCRCVCPSTKYFSDKPTNDSSDNDNHRRYYTMTSINPSDCNPQSVVKRGVEGVVDNAHIDAFLANCDCRFESRNTVVIKVVVFFVISVLLTLVVYMGYLMCFDPMLRKRRLQMPYRQQRDEIYMEDNMFSNASNSEMSIAPSQAESDVSVHGGSNMRSRNHVLGKVEAEQNRWMRKVEEQRKKIFEDHTMLN